MGSSIFPIVEVTENKLVSINGNTGYFYEIKSPDLEQLCPIERKAFFNSVSWGLDSLKESSYYKFYNIDGRSYLETNSLELPNFSGVEFLPKKDPLKVFFGGRDLFSDVGIYDDYLSFNGNYLRIFSVSSFSEDEIGENFLPDDVDYVLSIRKSAKEKSLSKLERIRSGHLSSFLKNKRDIASEGTYQQAEELLYDLMHGEESLFEIELFFILKAYSVEQLIDQTASFQTEMSVRGIKTFIEGQSLLKAKSGLASLFNELIPGVRPEHSLRLLSDKTSHLSYLLPFRRSTLMDNGICLHDIAGNEIFFNPFEPSIKNRNMLVTGISGGGKSVFVNKIVHHLIDKHPTVILDKGGSFKRLTLYHDGEVMGLGFNPFQFKDPMYLRELILSVVDSDKFGKLEKGKLLKEIKISLEKVTTFKELLDELEKEFVGIGLYFEEIKDYFNDDELAFTSILYVDVENYPKGMIAPLIIFILEYFKRYPKREKILVFDECWSFLTNHSEFIDECFRTFRKTGAFPIAISQSLSDFSVLGRELSQSITNNSYFKVFFPQEFTTSNEISSFDIQNINSLVFEKGVFSECYLKSTDNKFRKTIRNYLSPLELELFHTEAGMDEKLMKFIEKFKDYFDSNARAIESYVRLKHDEHKNDSDFFMSYH